MKDSDAMNRLEEIFKSPMLQINLLAAVTGACAALMTWVFISMSQGIQNIFYGDSFIKNSLKGTDVETIKSKTKDGDHSLAIELDQE